MNLQPAMRLAEDIAAHFRHLEYRDAVAAIAQHIRSFWDPRMRAQLMEQVEQAGAHCDSLVAGAVGLLRR